MSEQNKMDAELRQIVTDALVSMVSGVTGLVPPTGQGQIPDFIQAPIDRAAEKISASLAVGVPEIRVVFDGPPDHESGRFVECEDSEGRSINAGEWRERTDGLWELIIAATQTVKGEQVQCSTCNDTAMIGDLPIECPDCCHDEVPSLPAAGSAEEDDGNCPECDGDCVDNLGITCRQCGGGGTFVAALSPEYREHWLRERAALSAQQSAQDVSVPRDFVLFLLGEAMRDGVFFDSRHPHHRGLYWWRKELRALLNGGEA